MEDNKLIAEFMGYTVNEDGNFCKGGIPLLKISDFKYDHDWNWLMRVVETITNIDEGKYSVDISSVGMWACYIKRDDISEKEITSFGGFEPIINVYKAVVQFIKWYNQNK